MNIKQPPPPNSNIQQNVQTGNTLHPLPIQQMQPMQNQMPMQYNQIPMQQVQPMTRFPQVQLPNQQMQMNALPIQYQQMQQQNSMQSGQQQMMCQMQPMMMGMQPQMMPQQYSLQFNQVQIKSEPNQMSNSLGLKLCLCPICERGTLVFDVPQLTWLYVARLIMFSLRKTNPQQQVFSIQGDVQTFVNYHWYMFSSMDVNLKSPIEWQQPLREQFMNKEFFEYDKDKDTVKLLNESAPYEGEALENQTNEIANSSRAGDAVDPIDTQTQQQQNTEQVQNESKESYIKTLQIAKTAFASCQKALQTYTGENSRKGVC